MIRFSNRVKECIFDAENECKTTFEAIDRNAFDTQLRVLNAFQSANVSARHFTPSLGYGYDDIGRDTFDIVCADALEAESALVRPQFVNGTHALFTMLSGITKPGDTILGITGEPYDTLIEAIGIRGNAPHSLKENGISFDAINLTEDGAIDIDTVMSVLNEKTAVVYAQRSRGYAWRNAFSQDDLEPIFERIKEKLPNVIIAVDNCYCEFVEPHEPVFYGADVMAGSFIKNPGGGLAPTGGYIAGNAKLIDRCAQRLTVPGMGGEVGSYAGDYRLFYQGLFMAPHTVAQCLKTAVLFAQVFELFGLATLPASDDHRSDIVQAVRFDNEDDLIAFCKAIQAIAPVDSNVTPEPWDMPGYEDQVIMAAGNFVQGATVELSADGPVIPPYIAYFQGALTYEHGKAAVMMIADRLLKERQ